MALVLGILACIPAAQAAAQGGPTFTVAAANASEFGTLTFKVALSGGDGTGPYTVDFATQAGSADAPGDFTEDLGTLTFTADGTQQVSVAVVDDSVFELTETLSLALSNPTGPGNPTVGAPALGTITDNDTPPVLTITNPTVAEGNAGTTDTVFTVTRTGATEVPVTGTVAITNVTAEPGDHGAPTPTTITIPAGGPTATTTITVPVNGDTIYETNETFDVDITSITAATPASITGTGTITNDDTPPVLTITNPTVAEGSLAAPGTLSFVVTRAGGTEIPITATVAVVDITAEASDHGTPAGTGLAGTVLTIAPASATSTITVPINGDATYETDETVQLVLSSITAATPASITGTGTITNDDTPPVLTIDNPSVGEGSAAIPGTLTFTVTRAGATEVPVTANVALTNITAEPGDHGAVSASALTIAPTATTATITVPIVGDSTYETDETVQLALSSVTGATPASLTATGTIVNDDAVPTLSIANASAVTEGGTAALQVTLTGATEVPTTVNYATASGTALGGAPADPQRDFTTATGTLTFPGGTDQVQNIAVATFNDAFDEVAEDFTVTLSGAGVDGPIATGGGTATGTINDDDLPPTASITSASATEPANGTGDGTITFNVSLSAPSGQAVSIPVQLTNSTALGSSAALPVDWDFNSNAGPATIAVSPNSNSGPTTGTFTVTVRDDNFHEATETFTAALQTSPTATASGTPATGTINDNDAAPTLSVVSTSVDEGVGIAQVTLQLSARSGLPISASYSTAQQVNGNFAAADIDYATVAPPGVPFVSNIPQASSIPIEGLVVPTGANATSQTVTVPVAIINDNIDEFDEPLTINVHANPVALLSNLAGVTPGTLTILDNDTPPTIAIDANVQGGLEGDSTVPTPRDFTGLRVRLLDPVTGLPIQSGKPVTASFAAATDVSTATYSTVAGPGADFMLNGATTFTLTPGQTEFPIPMQIVQDLISEAPQIYENAAVRITLTPPPAPDVVPRATLGNAVGQVLIVDDDAPPTQPFPADDTLSTQRNAPNSINVLANDVDYNPLDVLQVLPTSTSQPSHGTATCLANGMCTYTPATDFAGTDSFTYTVWDGTSDNAGVRRTGTASVNVTVAATNRAPVAVDDAATTVQASPVVIPVLANDTDVDGNSLTVIGSTGGANGTVNCHPTNGCTYTPSPSFSGTDTFTYTVSDGTAIATATVRVTVTPTPPNGGGGIAATKPMTVAISSAKAKLRTGARVSYMVTLANPNQAVGPVTAVTVCLPRGFRYVKGSSRGLTRTNPRVTGCGAGKARLTWKLAATVPGGRSAKLTFAANSRGKGATVAMAGASSSTLTVKPLGGGARVTLMPPPR